MAGGVIAVCGSAATLTDWVRRAGHWKLVRSHVRNHKGDRVPRSKRNSRATELRVIKKLAPGDRGAKGLASEYGEALICVRHRQDASGTKRLTTVELIVSEKEIHRRPGPTVDLIR